MKPYCKIAHIPYHFLQTNSMIELNILEFDTGKQQVPKWFFKYQVKLQNNKSLMLFVM